MLQALLHRLLGKLGLVVHVVYVAGISLKDEIEPHLVAPTKLPNKLSNPLGIIGYTPLHCYKAHKA